MNEKKSSAEYYFDYQKKLEQDELIDQKINEKLLPYMKQLKDFFIIKDEIKKEILQELQPELQRIIRNAIADTTLNIKIR